MATTDADGATIGIYQPDFSGNYRTIVGARPDTIGITGKPYYPELGLYYYGARWYDPQRGRWMSEEPLGLDGPNMYNFGFNQPSNGFDVHGNNWSEMFLDFATGQVGSGYMDAGMIAKLKANCNVGCAAQTANGTAANVGMTPFPKFVKKPGAPKSCDSALCTAAADAIGGAYGSARNMIRFWNQNCAQKGNEIK